MGRKVIISPSGESDLSALLSALGLKLRFAAS
jgi:hypothetical protein